MVASFSILGDMVRQIAGDGVALRVLAGPETDAHAFQPRPSDAEAVRGAAVVVRNGLGFEPWLDRLLRSAGHRGIVVTASEGVAAIRTASSHGHAGDTDAPDPHAWQDVGRARIYAARIGEGLAKGDPPRAAAWREAAAAYGARLAALDRQVRQRIGDVAPERRVVVTSHNSFGYFGAAYGVRFLAPQGIGAGGAALRGAGGRADPPDPGGAHFRGLPRRAGQPGADGAPGARRRRAAARGRLYADTLSAPDGPAPDYEAMQRHNVDLLVAAMRDEAA